MAVPTNSYATYDSANKREDFIDTIFMVENQDKPFTSRIKKTMATATKHEWQTQALAAANAANAFLEGDDAATEATIPTVRADNYTQISRKVARVTGTQQAVNKAGPNDEMGRQKALKMMELTRDTEAAALANTAKVAGNASTARISAGAESWIATNTSAGTGGVDPTGDGTDTRTDGTQRAFDEADLKTVLASCADNGGKPNLLLVGSFNKQAMSAFSGNGVTRNVEANKQTLDTAIDIYVSDFGSLEVVYSPQSRARSALAMDTDQWALATLEGRAMQEVDLAKTGDTERCMLIHEWTLEAGNEKANGIIADLTTS